jgi:uncharacterized caspase-like protein
MTERLLEFGKKAEGADVALFFYAGHGIAINGTNYLSRPALPPMITPTTRPCITPATPAPEAVTIAAVADPARCSAA